jgi:hypothetical protein
MRRLIIFAIFVSLSVSQAIAQKEGNIWYFGNHAGLDFNNDTVLALQNSAMWDNDNSSTVCNYAGQLLFYTNSDTIWNKLHKVMLNGTDLAGSITSGQCAVIVPQPGTSKYFIFTNAPFLSDQGLGFSMVDMAEDNGNGAVIMKNFQLFPYTTEKLDAIYNQSDDSYWIITHPFESAYYYVYKLTSNGLLIPPELSDPCALLSGGNPYGYNAIGQMTISPDGKMIASGVLSDGFIELCDFNMANGHISNSRIIPNFQNPWGIAFSPDSKMLYATRWWTNNVFVFNLSDTTLSAIIASGMLIGYATSSNAYNYQAGYMQLGPDNRIYISKYESQYLAVINFPDIYGLGCGFVDDGMYLGPKTNTAGLSRVPSRPSFPVSVPPLNKTNMSVRICPNPSNGNFKLYWPALTSGSEYTLEISDLLGKIIIRENIQYVSPVTLSFPQLVPGIYNLRIRNNTEVFTQKISIVP